MSEIVHYVVCPDCGDRVPIPINAVGTDRTDPSNVASCFQCNCNFDYDDEAIQSMPKTDWLDLDGREREQAD